MKTKPKSAGVGRWLAGLAGITGAFLLYVHLQVSLFQLSYVIYDQSQTFAERTENYRYLKFEVDRLKAPRRLEKEMQNLAMDLTLPREVQVIQVIPSPLEAEDSRALATFSLQDRLANILGRWIGVAQAKTDP